MNIIIDEFNDISGFTAFNTASKVTPENQMPDFIAGPDNTKSSQFKFLAAGDYIEKSGLSIDVTDYDYAICSFYSTFNKLTSDAYTISFDGTNEFKLLLFPYMTDQTFRLDEIATITKIRITYLGNKTDYLICSHCLAVTDNLPVDVFKSFQSLLEKQIVNKTGLGFMLGTIDADAGDIGIALNQIADSDLDHIDRYAVILIDDSVHSEKHLLLENDERYFKFGKLLDGETIKYDYTDGNVYLTVPVRYGVSQKEYNTPSISISGFVNTPILRGGKIETVEDTFQLGSSYARKDDQIYEYSIKIACIDRMESDLLLFMNQIVKDSISKERLWINGQRYHIYFDENAELVELHDAVNPIVALVYSAKLEIKEEIWESLKQPQTTSQNVTVTINQTP